MIFDFFRKPLGWLVGAIVAGLLVWWVWSAITRDARTQARLNRNQAEAAQSSGSDAVNTVGQAGDREAAIDAQTRANEKEIRNAEGSGDAVNPALRDAGLRGLCRRATYRNDPKCVQRANP